MDVKIPMMENKPDISEIWNSINKELNSFISVRIDNKDEAEDLLHDVFLKIHNSIGSLRDNEKIRPWIYQITRNLITDHYRQKKQRIIDPVNLKVSLDSSVPSGFMEEAVGDMIKMLDELPSVYCDALCQTELQGLSVREYGIKSGLSYSGAKSRVQRARIMLKDLLMKCCHYSFDKYGTVFEIHPAGCCCCSVNQ